MGSESIFFKLPRILFEVGREKLTLTPFFLVKIPRLRDQPPQ
jgi:hypothetical protein